MQTEKYFSDKEHRMLLSAIGREKKFCEENGYEDFVETIDSINRKIYNIQHHIGKTSFINPEEIDALYLGKCEEVNELQKLVKELQGKQKNNDVVRYFTFGTDENFPYQNGHIIVYGEDAAFLMDNFRQFIPNRPGSDCINCAVMYYPKEWDDMPDKYKGPCHATIRDGVLVGKEPDLSYLDKGLEERD